MSATDRKICVLDLETIANPAAIAALPEAEGKAGTKDPDKIAAQIEVKKKKQIEDLGKNPHTNIICVGSFQDFKTKEMTSFVLDKDLNEAKMLQDIWDYIYDYNYFVTFNGKSFDIECLRFHSMLHKVPISVAISQEKYKSDNHCDVRMVLAKDEKFAKGQQGFFTQMILGEGKPDGVDGSFVQHLWNCSCYDEIKDYCEDDVEKLGRLYERMIGYYV